MLKELFPGSTDFAWAIFKIPQISKHFSAIFISYISKVTTVVKSLGITATSVKNCYQNQ